jgi:hypothetical protein
MAKQVLSIEEFAKTTDAETFVSVLGARAQVLEAETLTDYNEGVCNVAVRGMENVYLFIDGKYFE